MKSPATIASGSDPDRVGDLGLERAVAVAQQHRHACRSLVGDGQVEVAVAGEVPRHDARPGCDPDRVGDRGLERAVAVAQQDRDGVEPSLATARSSWPSPVKSPATMAYWYWCPTGIGWNGRGGRREHASSRCRCLVPPGLSTASE